MLSGGLLPGGPLGQSPLDLSHAISLPNAEFCASPQGDGLMGSCPLHLSLYQHVKPIAGQPVEVGVSYSFACTAQQYRRARQACLGLDVIPRGSCNI